MTLLNDDVAEKAWTSTPLSLPANLRRAGRCSGKPNPFAWVRTD
jgi:hypothetical protein